MRLPMMLGALLVALMPGLVANAATLNVSATATPDAGLYDYGYTFTIAGTGLTLDNLYLGSDDISPLSMTLVLDGSSATNWSWLGNNTPQKYLQFFSLNGSTISSTDTFKATFRSALAPAATHFALGLNSATGAQSNSLSGLGGPSVATPEPVSMALTGAGLFLVSMGALRRRRSVVGE